MCALFFSFGGKLQFLIKHDKSLHINHCTRMTATKKCHSCADKKHFKDIKSHTSAMYCQQEKTLSSLAAF